MRRIGYINSKTFIFLDRGTYPQCLCRHFSLINPMQKAEPLRCLAMRTIRVVGLGMYVFTIYTYNVVVDLLDNCYTYVIVVTYFLPVKY